VSGFGALEKDIQKELMKMLNEKKPKIISDLPGAISQAIRNMANQGALQQIPSFQKQYPCVSPTVTGDSTAVNVSRICISNNGAYLLKWKAHNCPARLASDYTSEYPIDQSRCLDMNAVFPDAVEGQVVRAGTLAIAGMHEIIDPPMRYVPSSNAAGFQCSGTTFGMSCNLISIAPISPSALAQVQKVCIINHAGFVMSYDVQNRQTKENVATIGNYPIDQTKCIDLGSNNDVKDGDVLQTVVHAFWGKTQNTNHNVQFRKNNLQATFECRGTTLNYNCNLMTSGMETAHESQSMVVVV
jgi:hypothetical protein